jgi:peptide/nickel transport system substrate-binding protein
MNQISARLMPQYDHLVGHHPQTNEEEPQLATEWEIEPDGKTYHWKLREGVPYYRDGKPIQGMTMSAQDVILTFGLMSGKESPNTVSVRPEFGQTPDVTVNNDHDITLRLAKISLDMPFLLSDEWSTGIVSKQHWDAVGGEEGYKADPIGSGPWSFVELRTNEYVLHERVENHYRQTPEFPEAQFLFVAEAATRLGMLLNNEAHIVSMPRALHQQAVERGMVVSKSTLPGVHMQVRFSWFQPQNYIDPATGQRPTGALDTGTIVRGYDPNDPLRNMEFRKALNLAINRDEINNTFINGDGFPEVDYFPPWRDDFKDEWAPIPGPDGKTGREGGWPYPYDPEEARAIIQRIYPAGVQTHLVVGNNQPVIPEQAEIGEAIAAYWQAIGVQTSLEAVPVSDVLGMWGARDRANTSYLISPSLDPICVVPSFIWYKGPRGVQDNPEIVEFKEKCDQTTNLEDRRQLSMTFGDWWVNNYISAPLVWLFGYAVVNPSIVQEYSVNMLHMGPIRYHEYTKAVLK